MDRRAVGCGTSSAGEILVADADADFRALASSAFGSSGFSVREATTGEEALAAARHRRPDAIVVDVGLPQLSGYELCRVLRDELGSSVLILFVSGDRTEPRDRVAGLLVGADDYLAKPCHAGELVARVRSRLRSGGATVAERAHGLTAREFDVLRLLAEGHDHQEIASELVISPKTVSSHLESIFRKLGVHSRAQAVALAYREGVLGLPG
jgi:DNA-binding NarL/FixJ family response regulator